jgi:hypothetical protein
MTKNKNDDLDFFDQQYFANLDTKPDLDKNRQNLLEKDIKSEEIKAEIEDLNYIDNLMFNQQSNALENSSVISNKNEQKHIRVEDLLNENDLSYFDELVFQSDNASNEIDDKSIGTIEQKRPNEKKNRPQVPLVTSKNLSEGNKQIKNTNISTNKIENEGEILKPSNHAIFHKEIPKWYEMVRFFKNYN